MRILLHILAYWLLSSIALGLLWGVTGWRWTRIREREAQFAWPEHPMRILELGKDEYAPLDTESLGV